MCALRIPTFVLVLLSVVTRSLAQQSEFSGSKVQILIAGEIGQRWEGQIREYFHENLWIQSDFRRIDAITNGVASHMPSCCLESPLARNTVTVCIVDGPVPACGANVGAFDLFPEQRCGVVWAACLKPEEEAGDPGADGVWLARIQKQTLFVAARLMGKIECPFWLCVMHADETIEDVDFKARGFCPPCRERMGTLVGFPN